MTERYLFGQTDFAARRLKVVAEAFGPSSRDFITAFAPSGPRLVVDMGCGPGHTTHLLADALKCERAVGLDNSKYFIGLAEKTATANVSFRLHDVTTVPFPDGPSDLTYGRFLLTHQSWPDTLIAKWATQLRPGGRLLLEETDSIHTHNPVFAKYLTIVEAMLADGGYDLYVGRKLDAMPAPEILARRSSRATHVPVTNDLAARMFSMNIQAWKHNAFIRENYSPTSVRQLEERLIELAAMPTGRKDIEWRLRQIVFERKGRGNE